MASGKRADIILTGTLLLCSVPFLLLALLSPISDPDFFGHLKTGDWIMQNRALPDKDLFTYTGEGWTSTREYFIITSYWLSQAFYSMLYSAGGLQAIIGMRFILLGIIVLLIAINCRGRWQVTSAVIVLCLVLFLNIYALERPQVFSFICFALEIFLIARMREKTSPASYYVLLPVLMMVWANLHGGYAVGQAIILLMILADGISFLLPFTASMELKRYRALVYSGLAGLLLSLANPNTYHALIEVASIPSYMTETNIEYKSALFHFLEMDNNRMALLGIIICLAAAAVLRDIKRPDIFMLALIAGTGIAAYSQIRYIAFFLIAAIPVIAAYLSGEGRLLTIARGLLFSAAVAISLFVANGSKAQLSQIRSGELVNQFIFPVRAAEFIAENDLKGNMYNSFHWGAYLIWRLGPERKVFIDGRNLHPHVYAQSLVIDTGYSDLVAGVPHWKALFEAYGVKYVATTFFYVSGRLVPLVPTLINDKEWLPVFFKGNSMVFVKDIPENYEVIHKYSIPKNYFIEDLLAICTRFIEKNRGNILPYIAKGEFLMSLGRYAEAKAVFTDALRVAPMNRLIKEHLKKLEAESLTK